MSDINTEDIAARLDASIAWLRDGVNTGAGISVVDMVDLRRMLEERKALAVALYDLRAQVELFCERYGEADFETGRAAAALSLVPDVAALARAEGEQQ